MTWLGTTPTTLNGYPVINWESHDGQIWTVMCKLEHGEYCVATWWPDLGDAWSWGHYSQTRIDAERDFNEVRSRNRMRP